jgi:hypothetical protein
MCAHQSLGEETHAYSIFTAPSHFFADICTHFETLMLMKIVHICTEKVNNE